MSLNRRGFTLGEVLASLIALGIIALTVQSLILVANNFLNQQSANMSGITERSYLNKFICHKFQRPVYVEQDPKRSFEYTPTGTSTTYTKLPAATVKNKATLSVPLLNHSGSISSLVPSGTVSTEHGAVQTFLNANLREASNENDKSKELRAHLNDKVTSCTNVDGGCSHNHYSQFYDIYADNHTLPTFVVQYEGDNELGEVSDGFIYASRCIKNEESSSNAGSFIETGGKNAKGTIIDQTDNEDMNSPEVLAVSLYVLEQKWRPFYFPEKDSKDQVRCCDISSSTAINSANTTSCKSLAEYTPIVYAIRISSARDLEDDILNGVGTNLASLKGYVNNELSNFKNHPACKDSTGTKIDFNGQDSNTSQLCEPLLKDRYFKALGEGFAHPVKFESISELPLIKRDRVNAWAYGFIAPSFGDQGQADMHKEFKLLSVENRCHASMPVGLCGQAKPGVALTGTNAEIKEYFITEVSHCPFHYVTMSNSGATIPLGVMR